MIISDHYKYLFIEIPLTASWAIRNELCKYYDGVPILHKHATYAEYRKIASEAQLKYFIFATVRNPLDCIVSRYYKFIGDHKGIYTNPEFLSKTDVDYSDVKKFQLIKDLDLDFEGYFRKFYKIPFSDMADLSNGHYHYVIRFEELQSGFSKVLRELNISQVRPVPITNKTEGRKTKSFEEHYTPGMINKAQKICGPYMKKWNYNFPDGWRIYQPNWMDQMEYNFFNKLRYIYMINFRYNDSPYAKVMRSLRGKFVH